MKNTPEKKFGAFFKALNLMFYCLYDKTKYIVLHDKINDITSSYSIIIDDFFTDNVELPFKEDDFIFFAEKDIVMFLIEPSWFIDNKDKIVNQKYNTILQNINEEDNPILIMAKVK